MRPGVRTGRELRAGRNGRDRMPGVLLSDAAAAAYDALSLDGTAHAFLDRLDGLFAELARDPEDVRFRRSRFQRPPCFRFTLAGPDGGRWCVLWLLEGDDVVVLYLGSDQFR